MNDHLDPDQIARCLAGQATDEEHGHIRRCAPCQSQVDEAGDLFALFKSAVQNSVDAHVEIEPMVFGHAGRHPQWPSTVRGIRWGWGVAAAAAVLLLAYPFVFDSGEVPPAVVDVSADTDPESMITDAALIDAVNRHLSRPVPAPLEPLLMLLPEGNSLSEQGGPQ